VEKVLKFNRIGAPGWWWNGRVMRSTTFGFWQIKLLNSLLPVVRPIDRFLPFPHLSWIMILRVGEQVQESAVQAATPTLQPAQSNYPQVKPFLTSCLPQSFLQVVQTAPESSKLHRRTVKRPENGSKVIRVLQSLNRDGNSDVAPRLMELFDAGKPSNVTCFTVNGTYSEICCLMFSNSTKLKNGIHQSSNTLVAHRASDMRS